MNRILITSLFLIFSLSAVWGQNSYWEEALGPYGGEGILTKASNGKLFYRTNSSYLLFSSSDDGFTWKRVPNPPIDTSANNDDWIMAGEAGNLYKVLEYPNGQNHIYRSVDEGESWDLIIASDSILKLVETSNGTLIAATSNRLLRSTDSGQTWSLAFSDTANYLINTLFIGNNGDVWAKYGNDYTLRSQNEGQSWAIIYTPYSGFGNFSTYVTNNGTIIYVGIYLYRSTNGGQTFQQMTIDTSTSIQSGTFCTLSNGRILYTNIQPDGKRIFYSDNNGLTWHLLNTDYHARLLYSIRLTDGTIFANRISGLYRSSDGGLTWQFSSKGIRAFAGKLFFDSKDTIYAGNAGSLLRTYNGGVDWEKVSSDVFGKGQFHCLIGHNELVFTLDDHLFYSNDGGTTQVDVTPPTGTDDLIVNVHPITKTFIASNTWGTMRSIDTGQTWTNVSDEIKLLEIEFHPTGVVYANGFDSIGSYYSLYKSADDGQHWEKIASIDSLLTFCISINGKIFALTHNGLYRSSFHGDTWDKQTLPPSWYWNQSVIISDAQGFLFLNDFSNLYLSVNDGHSWQTLPHLNDLTDFENEFPIRSIALAPDQHLYVTFSNVGTFRSAKPTLAGTYLTGSLLRDSDADCSSPDAQLPLQNWNVKAEGNFTWYTTTDGVGHYLMFLDTGSYQVSVRPPQNLWWSVCDSTQTVVLDELLTTDTADFSALALAECPLMSVSVATPFLRRCFDNTLFVHYCNQGSETADSAWVDVFLDPYMSFVSSAQPYNDLGNNVFRFLLGDVESGECGQFSLVSYVDCDSTVLGQTHCITAHAFPDTLCMTVPNWLGATIEAEVECQDTSVQFLLRNTGNAPSQTLDYIIIEDDVVLMQGQDFYAPGEEKTILRPANGHTWRIESQQEPGHPFSNVAVAFTEGCGGFESLGFINQFNVNTFQPSWNRFCLENIGAYDPNDKQGFPLGFGSEHRIRPGQELDYMIRFQNTGTDTAFNVVIRDTLSAWLDPASVRPGAASHSYTWELSGQGVLSFTFANILLPDSNTNLAASQGFITFKINQQSGMPLQTQIFNSAAIYFDFNPPVITNQTLHTVGVDYLVGTNAPTDFGKQNRVVISPNPVAELAVFQLKEGIFNQHRIIVTDAFGRTIHETEVSGKQYLFHRKTLPPGTFFFRVEDAEGRLVDSGKMILK